MTYDMRERVLDKFDLTGDQRLAAGERLRNVAVTAGAGSGKTRTLVARYVSLLADGFSPAMSSPSPSPIRPRWRCARACGRR